MLKGLHFQSDIYEILSELVWMKPRTNMKFVHVGSKTSLLGQILEKLCVCPRDQILDLMLMKLGQSVCLDKILYIFSSPEHNVLRMSYCD